MGEEKEFNIGKIYWRIKENKFKEFLYRIRLLKPKYKELDPIKGIEISNKEDI